MGNLITFPRFSYISRKLIQAMLDAQDKYGDRIDWSRDNKPLDDALDLAIVRYVKGEATEGEVRNRFVDWIEGMKVESNEHRPSISKETNTGTVRPDPRPLFDL